MAFTRTVIIIGAMYTYIECQTNYILTIILAYESLKTE